VTTAWAFMPHGSCIGWDPFILWTKAASDATIAGSYLAIPVLLLSSIKHGFKRSQWRTLVWMFAFFIFGCGATHVMDVVTIWRPWYYVDAAIRMGTAIAAVLTALVMWIFHREACR